MNKYIFISLMLFISVKINAQTITGTTTDETNQPIEFVNVALYSLPDTLLITGTTTDLKGDFTMDIPPLEKKDILLRASFIGYMTYEQKIEIPKISSSISVVLQEESVGLNEVSIIAKRPVISIKDGILTTTVANTLLSNEHSISDVLSKIPGLINNRGSIEVFGSGAPVMYINNRKVQNKSDLAQLDVKDIKNIELITNPGARYDADVKAVIKIYTLKRDDGLSVQIGVGATQSEKFSHNQNIRLGYKNKRLTSSLYYSFYDYSNKSFQHLIKEIEVDTLWQYETNRESLPTQKIQNYRLNFDYEFSLNHIAGLQVNGTHRVSDDFSEEHNIVKADNNPFKSFDLTSRLKMTTDNPQINAFYNAIWNKRLNSALNLDYVYYKDNQNQYIDEKSSDNSVKTQTRSESNYKIVAAKYLLDYELSLKSSLIGGIEYNLIDGTGNLISKSALLNSLDYKSKEKRYSSFIDYNYKKEKLSLNGGIRYEHVDNSYIDLINSENNLRKSYNNLFPSLRISYKNNSVTNSLSFSVKTQRPSLSSLNGRTYYQNRFMYQQGNPQLIPQTSYVLQWLFGYKFINFNTSYTHTNNYITQTFVESPENSSVIVSTWENFDNAKFLKANLNLRHSFNIWNPSLSVGIIKPFFSSEYKGETITYNKLNYYVLSNNYFKLPKGYTLSVDYYFNNGGNQRIFMFEPFQFLNLGLQKSFLNDKLSVNIKANDILRTMNYKETARINNLRFYQNENYSEWNFSISFIYRFNQQKLKYRGKSGASEDINRL